MKQFKFYISLAGIFAWIILILACKLFLLDLDKSGLLIDKWWGVFYCVCMFVGVICGIVEIQIRYEDKDKNSSK